jgi:IclR family transcriptional regulator, acetate operon repressor
VAVTDDRYRVQSLGRGLDLLEIIARCGREGCRLSDLAREISLSKAACHALLQTLLARGFITNRHEGIERRYWLGMTLARLGNQAISNISLANIAVPVLHDLTATVGLTSRVAVLDDGYAVVIGRVDAPGTIRFNAALGRHELPHCSAAGKALLASLPIDEVERILGRTGLPRRTPQTITSTSALMRELIRTAQRGYAIDNEEDTEGVQCIGTCVFDHTGMVAGAISVTGLTPLTRDRDYEDLAQIVVGFADRISRGMGEPTGRMPGLDRPSESYWQGAVGEKS